MEFLFVLFFLGVILVGLLIGCRLIITWPGRTPADPE